MAAIVQVGYSTHTRGVSGHLALFTGPFLSAPQKKGPGNEASGH